MNFIKKLGKNIKRNFIEATENVGDAVIPKKARTNIQNYLRRADICKVPYFKYGLTAYGLIILSFILTGVFIFSSPFFLDIFLWQKLIVLVVFSLIFFILLFAISIFIYRVYIELLIQIKVNKMEYMFPEFLSALALNLRTGGTLDSALENSTDKEFGSLSEEIKLVVRRIKLGGGVEEAISEFRSKYKSELISDTFELILLSWRKGGDTASLVERIYDNTKSARFLNNKIIASVTNYKIFLTVLALGITPAMFALTYHLIDLIKRISLELSNVPNNVAMPFSINAIRMQESGFIWFSVLSVMLISICISIIISIVKSGDMKSVHKQLILYAALSVISYQFFMWVFSIFFSLFLI
jgi:pilus assembly protein TadC